jgi:hypothetical protein
MTAAALPPVVDAGRRARRTCASDGRKVNVCGTVAGRHAARPERRSPQACLHRTAWGCTIEPSRTGTSPLSPCRGSPPRPGSWGPREQPALDLYLGKFRTLLRLLLAWPGSYGRRKARRGTGPARVFRHACRGTGPARVFPAGPPLNKDWSGDTGGRPCAEAGSSCAVRAAVYIAPYRGR